MGGLDLYFSDMYPGYSAAETSTVVQPDEEMQVTEQDDQSAAEKADNATAPGASKRNIFLALLLLVILAAVLGMVD